MEKRIEFEKGKQKEFLDYARKKLNLGWSEFADILSIKKTTLKTSYRFEYCNISDELLKKICYLLKISKKNILNHYKGKLIEYIPIIIGRKVLGESRTKLPEILIEFNKLPSNLNISKISLSRYDKERNINLPKKLTPFLAEEIGIHLGDGFLSDKRYDYRVKGNKDEKKYYDKFINPLYKNLYNINLEIKEYETTYGFELYSKALWEFKVNVLKIKPGRKDNISIPGIIKVNNQPILTSFIRGLFDTDGNINFRSNYGFKKYYPRIELVLISKKLIKETSKILSMLGLKPYVYKDKENYWHITLSGYDRLKKYSKLINWHNPKHLLKVKKWKEMYPELGKEVMVGVV